MENRNILRGLALVLLIASFFIEIEYLSKSFLLSGAVIGGSLFNSKNLQDIKNRSLFKNISDFLVVVFIITGFSFILQADNDIKTKIAVGCLVLLFGVWRFIKFRR